MEPVFEEKYPHEKGFSAYFADNIAPILHGIEIKRHFTQKLYYGCWAFLIAVVILLYTQALLRPDQQGTRDNPLGILWGGGFIALLVTSGIKMYFEYRYKNILMPLIMGFFKNIRYNAKKGIDASALDKFVILPTYNQQKSSDLIEVSGKFKSSCLQLKYETGSGKNRTSRVTFDGLAILIDLPRPVSSPVALKIEYGRLMNWLTSLGHSMKRVELVDPVFEKIYEVYSNDQVEARRVLQPDVMELFLRLNFLFANWRHNLDELQEMTAKVMKNHNIEEVRDNRKTGFQANFHDNNLLLLISEPQAMFSPISLNRSCYDLDGIRSVLYQASLIDQICTALRR